MQRSESINLCEPCLNNVLRKTIAMTTKSIYKVVGFRREAVKSQDGEFDKGRGLVETFLENLFRHKS